MRDPDRVAEAESLLGSVRERLSPPPAPPEGPGLEDIEGGDSLAVRAAKAVADAPGRIYTPLYVMGPRGSGRSTLLIALANALREQGLAVAFMDGATFAEELIGALERSRLDVWRARYRRADVLVLDDLDQLAGLERGHEELFHLFEELHRDGRQLVFSATLPPQELPLPSRLKSRLEAGLVVELEPREERRQKPVQPGTAPRPHSAGSTAASPAAPAPEAAPDSSTDTSTDTAPSRTGSHWILSREKVLWEWPYVEDWIQETPD